MEKLLTVNELAEILQVSPYTLRLLCRAGDIPFIKVGGQYRFMPSAIMHYLEKSATKASYNFGLEDNHFTKNALDF